MSRDPDGGRPGPRSLGTAPIVLLVALGYWFVASAGRSLADYGVVTAVWPAAGYALAVLTRGGPRLAPGVFLGVVLAVGVDTSFARLPIVLPPLAVVTMAVGNTGEALVGAAILRGIAGFRGSVDTVREVLGLLLVPPLASLVSATVGTLTLVAVGVTPQGELPDTWWTWWVGNALGVLCVAPFLLAVTTRRGSPPGPGSRLEAAALVAIGGVTAAYAMFGAFPSAPRATREAWLLFPLLVWAAMRFGPRFAAGGILVVSSLALASTAWRLDSHPDDAVADAVLRLQVFLGVMAAQVVLLAAAASERWAATAELRRLNRGLEGEVERRTAELREANELLAARNAALGAANEALGAANEALDAFAARVAHDLRAPVRAVTGFAGALRERYGETLDADGAFLLERVALAGRRMTALIDGLLAMSRVGRRALVLVDVDTRALVERVAAEVDPDRRAAIEVGPLPRCRADVALLEVVFTNLLDNAVKYSRDAQPPHIAVGGDASGDTVRFWVRDNGDGFEMAEAGRLFQPFFRLHGARVEGTGLGLATVRRIVELHGGRVGAEGAVGVGATFWFELPDPSAERSHPERETRGEESP